jgi:hypothetical protein
MSRTQNLRWKRKAIVTGIIAVSFAGYAALGNSTVSAANYGEWDCSQFSASVVGSNEQPCPESTDGSYDSVPDETIPQDSIPEDSVPVDTTPVETDPPTTVTQPVGEQFPPSPTAAPTTAAPAAVPVQVLPQSVSTTPSLPVTGRGSALPTAFIAVGLLGAGSVALAFARRNSAGRTNES